MTSKAKRIEDKMAQYAVMSRKDLQEELCQTLVGTLMPLIEKVVERRVSQWIEVIGEGLRS